MSQNESREKPLVTHELCDNCANAGGRSYFWLINSSSEFYASLTTNFPVYCVYTGKIVHLGGAAELFAHAVPDRRCTGDVRWHIKVCTHWPATGRITSMELCALSLHGLRGAYRVVGGISADDPAANILARQAVARKNSQTVGIWHGLREE